MFGVHTAADIAFVKNSLTVRDDAPSFDERKPVCRN
jgi:hypothetical protein